MAVFTVNEWQAKGFNKVWKIISKTWNEWQVCPGPRAKWRITRGGGAPTICHRETRSSNIKTTRLRSQSRCTNAMIQPVNPATSQLIVQYSDHLKSPRFWIFSRNKVFNVPWFDLKSVSDESFSDLWGKLRSRQVVSWGEWLWRVEPNWLRSTCDRTVKIKKLFFI